MSEPERTQASAALEVAEKAKMLEPTGNVEIDAIRQMIFFSNEVAFTTFVPEPIRGNKPSVLAVMMHGHEQGIGPMKSLSDIHLLDGRPMMSGALMVGKIRQAGHKISRKVYRDEGGAFTGCTVYGERGDTQENDEYTFMLEDADKILIRKRGGGTQPLSEKDNYRNYPEAMCFWRAAAALARILFSDVFLGTVYVKEAEADDMYDVVEEAGGPEQPAQTKRGRAKAKKDSGEEGPAQPDDQGNEPVVEQAATTDAGAEGAEQPPEQPSPEPPSEAEAEVLDLAATEEPDEPEEVFKAPEPKPEADEPLSWVDLDVPAKAARVEAALATTIERYPDHADSLAVDVVIKEAHRLWGNSRKKITKLTDLTDDQLYQVYQAVPGEIRQEIEPA